jgi:hypothetical protein
MKRTYFLLSALALFVLAAPSVRSQELETGYFLGGNPYAFRMNPAFQSERNIFSIALGGTGLGTWSNLGISSLFYPGGNGYLYTFMNDRVSPAEFQRKIGRNNRLDLDARVNLLTLGFWADRRFYTIDLNVRSLNAVSAPSDLFAFLKEGAQGGNSFDFSGTSIRAKEFVELAFGWSKNYNNVFNAGFRVKALVGAAEAEVLAESMKLSMASDRWEIQARSVLNASSPSLVYRREGEDLDVGSIEFGGSKIGPAGYGAALDLGASWNVLPFLTLSAAVLDLGPMRWNREVQGVSPETSYTWAPSDQEGGSDDTWEAEMDEATSALSGIFRFKDHSGSGGQFEMLPFRVNLGAEYRMPFYERLSVGLLYQGRGGAAFSRHTGRFSLNWNPLSFLSMSTGTTLSKMGQNFGFALNLHPAGINLLVGCDYIPFHTVNAAPLVNDLPEQFRSLAVLPRDQMKLNLYISLNLALGRSRLNFKKEHVGVSAPTPEPVLENNPAE